MSEPLNHFDDGAFGIGMSGEYGSAPKFIEAMISQGLITDAKASLWTNKDNI